MAQVIDTIEVLIEADSKGLETQLKRATQTVQSFISEINEGTVNWKSVLTKTLSPALVTGIASTVALAITKALSIEGAIKDAGAQSTSAFAAMGEKMTDTAVGISNSTGQAATDVASALALTSKYFKDSATATYVAEAASKLATAGFGDLQTIVQQLSYTLEQWGVTSESEARTAIDALVVGVREGKFSFGELTSEIGKAGVALRDSTSIDDAIANLVRLAAQTGFTKDTALETFHAITQAVLEPKTNMIAIGTGFGDIAKAVKESGIVGAIGLFESKIRDTKLVTVELASQIGLSASAVKSFATTSSADFIKLKTDVDTLKQSFAGGLNRTLADSISTTDTLSMSWNKLTNALASFLEKSGALSIVKATINSLSGSLNLLGDNFSKIGSIASDSFGQVAEVFGNVITGGLVTPTKQILDAVNQAKNTSTLQSLLPKLNQDQLQSFINKGSAGGLSVQDLVKDVQGNYNNQFLSTFNINSTEGKERLTAEQIANKLYGLFQGQVK